MAWKYILTYILSMTPLFELRLSIPYAYFVFKLPIVHAALISLAGAITAVFLILWLLPIVVEWADHKFKWLHNLLNKIFAHTHKKHSHKAELIGEFFLMTFVAIPLPGSGVFMGSLLAYLFDVPRKQAFFVISIGAVLGAIVMVFITTSSHSLFELFIGAESVAPIQNPIFEMDPLLEAN